MSIVCCTRSFSLLEKKRMKEPRSKTVTYLFIYFFLLMRALYTHLSTIADSCNSSGKQKPQTTKLKKKTLLYVTSSSICLEWPVRIFFLFFRLLNLFLPDINIPPQEIFILHDVSRTHREKMTQLFISDLIRGLYC
jgi:hypothetical protein